ncbi:hypothetical protein HAX54_048561 [Datura stramonium]|uniref:Uncharacterized protein n=1 Tax=Datura stramonium TaxID=4076 RepID=A0ABS8SVR6_DATST|nr:hypothetical protein [Datura stramonium]
MQSPNVHICSCVFYKSISSLNIVIEKESGGSFCYLLKVSWKGTQTELLNLKETIDAKVTHTIKLLPNIYKQQKEIKKTKTYTEKFSYTQLPRGELEVEARDGVRGTCEHIDPEYCCSAIVTQKTDVYGFGNVLFQLLIRKRMYMRDGVITNIEECNVMDIVDPAIVAGEPGIDHEIRQQLEDYLNLVKRCTASKGEDRPYMICVAKELRGIEKCFSRPQ